ncbi:MAG: TlyA family RNA methyltransferase [Clostridia bacterium]|nr:TlyA family RNA methyltransferase [Clostridia bacterium]
MSKRRLDTELVARGLAESREKAQALILSGAAYVRGQRAAKASQQVTPEDEVTVRGAEHPYVSRGALKLERALRTFSPNVGGAVAVDVGASSGGFTDVLLRAGARRVYAVDVGYGQLDWKLRTDPRVTVMERTNARYLAPENFAEAPALAVMDVSFISILKILPALFAILGEGGRCISLIKPQFEAGRERVGKKGVVRDPATHRDVIARILPGVDALGWHCRALDFSPVKGPEGNIEFWCDLLPGHGDASKYPEMIARVVEEAHRALAK